MGLQEEFDAYLATKEQSSKFGLEEEFRSYLKDQAQGGSIRQAPIQGNPPIGAVIGGVGTALATGNPALATLGAAAGEAGQQLVEHAIGSPAAPPSTAEAAIRMGREGLTQGLMEAVGGTGGFLLNKARSLAPFAKSVSPEAKEAMAFVQEHGGLPQSLLPAEMSSSRVLDIMQNISEHSILGGGAIATFKKDRDLFNTQLAQGIVNRYGPQMSADDVGRAVVDSATKNLEAAKFQSKFIYNAIEHQAAPEYATAPKQVKVSKTTAPIMGKQAVPPSGKAAEGEISDPYGMSTKTLFQDIQVGEQLEHLKVMLTEQETQIGGTRIDLRPLKEEIEDMTRTTEGAKGLANEAMGNTLVKFINSKPDMVSYPVAKAIRTEVRAYRDALMAKPETKNAPGIGKAKSIYGKLTDRIREGLADDDPFLAQMWDEANLIEAGANRQFNDKFIRELVKMADMQGGGAPEAVVEKVWRAGRPSQIKVVRNALDPLAWGKLQSIEMERLMEQSLDPANGMPSGKKMEKALFGKNGLGEDALKAGFDPTTVEELRGFVNTLKTQQANQGEGTGRVWIQLAQAAQIAGGIGSVAGVFSDEYGGAGLTLGGGGILFGPAVISKIMTSPSGIKWLTQGLSHSPKSAKFLQAATQIGKILEAGVPRTGPEQEPVPPVPSTQLQPMGNVQ